MNIYKVKTFYSTNIFLCDDIELFLSSICFCDAYEVTSVKPATASQLERYTKALNAGCNTLNASHYALRHCTLSEALHNSI